MQVGHVQNVDITTVSRDLLPNMSRCHTSLEFAIYSELNFNYSTLSLIETGS